MNPQEQATVFEFRLSADGSDPVLLAVNKRTGDKCFRLKQSLGKGKKTLRAFCIGLLLAKFDSDRNSRHESATASGDTLILERSPEKDSNWVCTLVPSLQSSSEELQWRTTLHNFLGKKLLSASETIEGGNKMLSICYSAGVWSETALRIFKTSNSSSPTLSGDELMGDDLLHFARDLETKGDWETHLVAEIAGWSGPKTIAPAPTITDAPAEGKALRLDEAHLETQPITAHPFDAPVPGWRRFLFKPFTVVAGLTALVAVILWTWPTQHVSLEDILQLAQKGTPPGTGSQLPDPKLKFAVWAQREGQPAFRELEDGQQLSSIRDKYKLQGTAAVAGWWYVFQADASGRVQWLFPSNPIVLESCGLNPVISNSPVQIPAEWKGYFVLDQVVGSESFFVVFSTVRWPKLESLLKEASAHPPTGGSDTLRGMGGWRGAPGSHLRHDGKRHRVYRWTINHVQ